VYAAGVYVGAGAAATVAGWLGAGRGWASTRPAPEYVGVAAATFCGGRSVV